MVELKDTPGVRTADIPNKLGIWAGSTGEIFFDDAEVPAENVIGEEGGGFKVAMYSLDQGRFTVAAGAVGVIRACLELSTKYANERETFGQQIGRYQFVQDMIADMVLMYEQARLVVLQAAHDKNRARETGARTTRSTSIAKTSRPSTRSRRPTSRCRSTARTATRPSTAWSGTCATAARRACTRARRRSTRCCWPRTRSATARSTGSADPRSATTGRRGRGNSPGSIR